MKRFVDCLCWGQHLDDCPNYVSLVERRAFYAAIAAGTRSAETRSKAPSEGCQSGAKQSPKDRFGCPYENADPRSSYWLEGYCHAVRQGQ